MIRDVAGKFAPPAPLIAERSYPIRTKLILHIKRVSSGVRVGNVLHRYPLGIGFSTTCRDVCWDVVRTELHYRGGIGTKAPRVIQVRTKLIEDIISTFVLKSEGAKERRIQSP